MTYKCYKCESEHTTDNMVAYCASCYSELKSNLAEKEKRIEELERPLNHDRAALEMHQASIIDLQDKDLLAIGGRLLDRAEKAEQELADMKAACESMKCKDLQEAKAEAWEEAQRWLVEIFELDAARKMQEKIYIEAKTKGIGEEAGR